jgi:hypothetical protein
MNVDLICPGGKMVELPGKASKTIKVSLMFPLSFMKGSVRIISSYVSVDVSIYTPRCHF